MSAHLMSRRNRTTGLFLLASIFVMAAAMIASSGAAAVPANSNHPIFTVAEDPPGAPTNLTATALSASEIGLSWSNPSGSLTDNQVFIYSGSTCSGSPTDIDLGGVYTSYADTPLTPSTAYSFEVTASTSGGEGPPSACATATTPPPPSPTGLAATALSTTEIGLSWANPSGVYLTGNNVSLWISATCSGSPYETIELGVYTSYAFSSLTQTTNYSFEVTASTSGIQGPPSSCVTATTPPPGAPTGLTAAAVSIHKINLSWTNPWEPLTANTVYEYSSGCSTLLNTYVIGVATTYSATGLKASTTYCFTVSASMNGGSGPQSSSASATTFNARPSAPTGLTATPVSDSEIDLAWTNPSGSLTANTVYENSSGCSTLLNTYVIGVATAYVVTDLTPSTTYCFTVSASTNGGAGPQSASSSATTPPSAPTGLTATVVSATEIDYTWTNPSGATDNQIYIWVGASCSGNPSGEADLGGVYTSYDATGLSPSTTYSVEVTAATDGVVGSPSACVTATTPLPPPPTALTATVVSSVQIDYTWTNPSGATDNQISIWVGASCSGSPSGEADLGGVYTSYDATGLSASTTYSVEVTATTHGVVGSPSACVTATTSSPAAPTGLTATVVSAHKIDYTWTNPSGATDNQIYIWVGASCSGNPSGEADLGGVYTSYDATGLSASTTYGVEVTATTHGVVGSPSACVTATTPLPPPPTALTATVVSSVQIDYTWTNPSSTTDNQIYIWVGASCSGNPSGEADLGGVYTSYDATGLSASTAYSVEVTATVDGVVGSPSTCVTATTPSDPPGTPTGLTATALSVSEIYVNWTNPSGTIDNQISVWVGTSCSGSPSGAADLGGVYTSYDATGLSTSTTYSFEVTASTSGGEGPVSNCVNATTFSETGGTPTHGLTGATMPTPGTESTPAATTASSVQNSKWISDS